MLVTALMGSPRKGGNTEFFTQVALDELERQGISTQMIYLADKKIAPCKACYNCIENKACVIEDDFQEVFDALVASDGILLSTPVYHASMTPELKCVLDRAGFSGRWAANQMKEKGASYDWGGTVFSGKVAAPLAVARRAGQDFAYAQLCMWLAVNDFIIAGSTYWNIGMAGKGGAFDAAEDKEGISTIIHTAQNMAHTIKQLKK